MAELFEPLQLRDLRIPNRVWMSPMCTYSAEDGFPSDFHLSHYASRAAGGAGLVMIEATGVRPEGRITPWCLGLWSDEQIPAFRRLADAITAGGAVPAVQLAHAGRKAASNRPWKGGGALPPGDGWPVVGPSAQPFPGHPEPAPLDREQIAGVVASFAAAARRALRAGFQVAEIHAAHGYLLSSFLSPASNHRDDEYGGSLANRARIVLEVIDAVRAVWPDELPVFLRISTTDWITEDTRHDRRGWTVEDSVELARLAGEHGVDLIDASSGGVEPAPVPDRRDYQTALAARVRDEAKVTVGAVGRITEPGWAEELLTTGQADAVFLGRALLRDPSWPNHAAVALGATPRFLEQYGYAV
ncbi:NADH:flavin oxidoreductase [Actinoplanes philippinensis]|uniref:NADH:flavin oxidoreductase/NADH oxidase n=1 Tax=Actinoplanes philippinensis TaxID=35752 RepID=UPI000B858E53|nr:NADH:flavin oxidoreductase/NADH oxidase [Actinoplanes philippinensis]GIE77343.1 NADH:flavin oxidoreductase [Actinoplanes philippinensis]